MPPVIHVSRVDCPGRRHASYRAVASVPPPIPRASSGAGRQNTVGVLLLTVGVLVTSVTYNAAEGGGTYVLAWDRSCTA